MIAVDNKMHSETTNFAIGAAVTRRTGRNMSVVFDSDPFAPLVETGNMTSSTKPEAHNILHCRQRTQEDRAVATGNMYRNVCEIWTHVFKQFAYTN